MKKIVAVFLTSIMLIATTAIPAFADENIKVLLNGQEMSFDVPPQIINNRTMIPMRAIFEELGFSVEWQQETQSVIVANNITQMIMPLGEQRIYMGTEQKVEHFTDVPAQAVNGRTLIPLRIVSELFGAVVNWNQDTQTVTIDYSKPEELTFVEGAPRQYGASHALIGETIVKLIKQRYGITATLVSTGNTLQTFEGNGYSFMVSRWYSPKAEETVYDIAEIHVSKL